MNDDPFHPFATKKEAQKFCKSIFTSNMLNFLKNPYSDNCELCPLDHRGFDKLGFDIGRSGYPCHVNYLALIGQLTKERYTAIMFESCLNNNTDILWCPCTERRLNAYKYITERDGIEIISVE